jgi:hypothetical protein
MQYTTIFNYIYVFFVTIPIFTLLFMTRTFTTMIGVYNQSQNAIHNYI